MNHVDTLENRIQQIDGWIRALTSEAHFLDERVHLLKPLVLDEDVKAALKTKLDKTPGVGLWNHLPPLLGQDYIRDLARLFLDKAKDTGSLTNIWRKLQSSDLKCHYRQSYSRMYDDLHDGPSDGFEGVEQEQWRKRDREKNLQQFDVKWESIAQSMDQLSNHPMTNKIKTFRDKHHAHWEMQPLGQDPKPFDIGTLGLTYSSAFLFGKMCEKILAELGLVLTHTYWDPEQFTSTTAGQGRSLWLTLSK